MNLILDKIWPDDDASTDSLAYAIAVSQTMLNPKYDKITMSDTAVKKLVSKNVVNIYLFFFIHFKLNYSKSLCLALISIKSNMIKNLVLQVPKMKKVLKKEKKAIETIQIKSKMS